MGTLCKNYWCQETEDRNDIANASDIAACGEEGAAETIV